MVSQRLNLQGEVWSTIYMNDVWASAGRNLKRTLDLDASYPWLIDELTFDKLTEDSFLPVGDVSSSASCMWSQMIPLTHIYAQIQDLNHYMMGRNDDQEKYLTSVSSFSDQLDRWKWNLPVKLQETSDNLAYFASKKIGHVFVALHVGYHYHCILLFYRFLHDGGDPAASLDQQRYAQQCKYHAIAISSLLWSSYQDFHVNCVWIMVSHLLVISSSVHLHTLLLSADQAAAISEARGLLEHNFQVLMRLRLYWPWLNQTLNRLKAFQEACLQAREVSEVFKMNDWLLRFLHEHNKVATTEEGLATSSPAESSMFYY